MVGSHRSRRLVVTAALAAVTLLLFAGCTSRFGHYPNSTFNHTTEFNAAIDYLWDRLLFFGTVVFILVEAMLIYVIIRFRRRPGQKEPEHVHGNTTLEIVWTVIPAIILVLIAIPTVRTIFHTQAKAVANALEVEVVGHQWWWEFRYPLASGDTVVTANELYLPLGRTVNFAMRTEDVIHSFWIPQLGGKRDVTHKTKHNYLWFTTLDSITARALNGSCNEYCGVSHANMKFRAFVVPPAEFQRWLEAQQRPAAYGTITGKSMGAAVPSAIPSTTGPATNPDDRSDVVEGAAQAGTPLPVSDASVTTAAYTFPRDQLPAHVVPKTPLPSDIAFPSALAGDPKRGEMAFLTGGCIGCHAIGGRAGAVSRTGPNLTHVASRHTIASGLYPNDREHLARWIKNSRKMKPGSLMPTLGLNEYDPIRETKVTAGGLTDQQIADLVAYLQALK